MRTVLWGSTRGVQFGSRDDRRIQAMLDHFARQKRALQRTNQVFVKLSADVSKAFAGFAKAMQAIERGKR